MTMDDIQSEIHARIDKLTLLNDMIQKEEEALFNCYEEEKRIQAAQSNVPLQCP